MWTMFLTATVFKSQKVGANIKSSSPAPVNKAGLLTAPATQL